MASSKFHTSDFFTSSLAPTTFHHAPFAGHDLNTPCATGQSARELGVPIDEESENTNDNETESVNGYQITSYHPSEDTTSTPPPATPPHTHPEDPDPPTRTETAALVERNARLDEVALPLSRFRTTRALHVRQLRDLQKKSAMVAGRIDFLNDSVEALRRRWGEIEREKAALLGSSERYEQRVLEMEGVVRRDDGVARRFHEYLTLRAEVLVLDEEEEGEREGERGRVHDWRGLEGHGRGSGSGKGRQMGGV